MLKAHWFMRKKLGVSNILQDDEQHDPTPYAVGDCEELNGRQTDDLRSFFEVCEILHINLTALKRLPVQAVHTALLAQPARCVWSVCVLCLYFEVCLGCFFALSGMLGERTLL